METRPRDLSTLTPAFLALLTLIDKGDETEPPNWATADALGEIEEEMIVRTHDFEGYASACDTLALHYMATQPEISALFRRGMFNGWRLIPGMDSEVLLVRAHALYQLILLLPPSKRRGFVIASQAYDLGVLSRDTGRFGEAAKLQQAAAAAFHAVGNHAKGTISSFLVAVETLNAALQDDDAERVATALGFLDVSCTPTAKALAGHRWAPNVALHALLGHAWASDLNYAGFDADAQVATESGWPHWARLAAAMKLVRDDKTGQTALRALNDIIAQAESDRHGDVTCTALLMAARVAQNAGFPGMALPYYERLAGWHGLKGRVPMAVGARERAKLG